MTKQQVYDTLKSSFTVYAIITVILGTEATFAGRVCWLVGFFGTGLAIRYFFGWKD